MSEKPFVIVQVTTNVVKNTGDYLYRLQQPSIAMGRVPGVMVINTSILSPFFRPVCRCADLLILHLTWEPDLLPIVAGRREEGLTTVYEISDNFAALPSSITHELSFRNPICLATTYQLIQLSDAVQAVSDILLERFQFLFETGRVFDNQIQEMGPPPRSAGNPVIIGWGGSTGHTEDLKWIAPALKRFCDQNDGVCFSFMGNPQQFEEVFGSWARSDKCRYKDPGSLSDYFGFLDTLDIGLAPLKDTPFNACRSDVKFIEYASRGVVPVLSDTGPYRKHARNGQNALVFKDPDQLVHTLESLIHDTGLMQTMKQKAYDYVRTHRLEQDRAHERIDVYRGLVKNRSPHPVPMESLKQIDDRGDLFEPLATRAEQKVVKGLDLKKKGQPEAARPFWFDAAREMVGYEIPLILAAETLIQENPEKSLETLGLVTEMVPDSLRAHFLCGQALSALDPEDSARAFKRTLDLFPGFAPAWRALAHLEMRRGNPDAAISLLDRALKGNPFYSAAAHDLGRLYAEKGDMSHAVQAFRVAADLIPEIETYTADLVKGLVNEGNMSEAIAICGDYLDLYPDSKHVMELYEVMGAYHG
jgi:tetratricopeptide (TPR) repeat protein